MVQKRGFLKLYLITTLVIALLALINDALFLMGVSVTVSTFSFSIFYFLFFFLSIIAIPLFHHFNIERIAYILPVYFIISYLIFSGVGGYLSAKNLTEGNILLILGVVSIISSLFEGFFSVYLIKKLDII